MCAPSTIVYIERKIAPYHSLANDFVNMYVFN